MTRADSIDTSNDFLLGSGGRALTPMLPVRITTREQAFRTAAWIALMGETLPSEYDGLSDPPPTFDETLEAVESR